MPLYESESLVLKSYGLAEADRIVVFFTRDHGIVRGVAKGAKRLKSRFGSTLELFSTVNLNYFQKDERELVTVQHIELVRSSFAAASDPELLHTLSYLAELLTAFVPPHDPNPTLYRMANATVATAFQKKGRALAIILYFELWMLRLGGYLPDWGRCDECERLITPETAVSMRSDFHLVCERCRGPRRMPSVPARQIELVISIQRVPPNEFVELADRFVDDVRELSAILRRLITQVIGRDLMNERTLAVSL